MDWTHGMLSWQLPFIAYSYRLRDKQHLVINRVKSQVSTEFSRETLSFVVCKGQRLFGA